VGLGRQFGICLGVLVIRLGDNDKDSCCYLPVAKTAGNGITDTRKKR
jgi:hypothetical protein